jgi:hypothetical protein
VVQRAYVENYQKLFEELKHHWTTTLPGQGNNGLKVIELFETLASRTKTLPIGQVLLHEMGFTEWTDSQISFQEKWSGEHSMWFTPLYEREDFQNFAKSNEATVLNLPETTHKVLVTRCIAGILNLDAYEPASGRRNAGDRTGFRIFTDTLKMLCTLGDDTDGENAFTKEKCNILYDNVTGGGAGLGRDRSLPIFIQQAFSGWIKKYDKKSSLERAIIVTTYARTRCHYEQVAAEKVGFDLIEKVHKAICIHIVDVCLYAVRTTPPQKIKKYFKLLLQKRGRSPPTLMDEIFTIKAVREVLTEGFSNAELGRKISYILPLVQEPRRGEYFPPDVGYR